MGLKSTEVTREEWLSEQERKEIGIDKGLVVIEVRNDTLREKKVGASDGYSKYLKYLGDYNLSDDDWKKR